MSAQPIDLFHAGEHRHFCPECQESWWCEGVHPADADEVKRFNDVLDPRWTMRCPIHEGEQ